MLTPRLTECPECANIPALLSEIDCKIADLAKIEYNNVIFSLNRPVQGSVISDLLNYKRILTNRFCNPDYACQYPLNQIASRVKVIHPIICKPNCQEKNFRFNVPVPNVYQPPTTTTTSSSSTSTSTSTSTSSTSSTSSTTSSSTTAIPTNRCTSAIVPPTTINGISITSSYTGSVSIYSHDYTSCGSVTTPINSLWVGSGGAFSYTLMFSEPVNNIVVAITASGHTVNENFIFTTNNGIPTISSTSSCYSTIVENQILSGQGAPSGSGGGGGGYFKITTSGAGYTTLTITGSGGANGSLFAFCADSITQ